MLVGFEGYFSSCSSNCDLGIASSPMCEKTRTAPQNGKRLTLFLMSAQQEDTLRPADISNSRSIPGIQPSLPGSQIFGKSLDKFFPILGVPKNHSSSIPRAITWWNKMGKSNLALLGTPVSWIIFPHISR